ncbi:MAG: hypothetical protein KGN34_15185 [Sphingomonadales bacterium]|nr:hypothetical protein [Sphingomonadales bacterium]
MQERRTIPGRAIWLLSDGRSGSTWFAQLLDHARTLHVEHEPIHALFNPRLTGEPLVPLPGSADIDGVYAPLIADVLAGRYRTWRFGGERDPRAGTPLVLRDIHALPLAPALLPRFPQVRPVLLVRHPVDVAQSKLALSQWQWFSAVERYATDTAMAATVRPLTGWIGRAETLFQRYVVHWAMMHRWFLDRFDGALTILPYPLSLAEAARAVAEILGGDAGGLAASRSFAEAWHRRSATDQPTAGRRTLARLLGNEPAASRADRRFAEEAIDAFGLRGLLDGSGAADRNRHAA